jgi:serine/threonine protein kinase
VFLTANGQVKLGDFGVARDLRSLELTDAGLTVGTYAYMAPELVRGERNITGQLDLYALGCLMVEMLTGHPPYLGDNFAAIFEQHLHADPPQLRSLGIDCPEKLDALIQQLLAKSPEDRPFNARSVQGVLGELCQETLPAASEQDLPAVAARPIQQMLARRIRRAREPREVSWTALGILGVGVIAAIVAMVLFWPD